MVVAKKRRKRISRGKKGKKSNMYFHEGTARAIEGYQQTVCPACDKDEKGLPISCPPCAVAKHKLYVAEIEPAFSKLVENLIFIHGFRGLHDTYEELKSDCVTFLYETIHKFDPTRGTKPFSYFNVVAKNWLIIRSKQRATSVKRNISIDNESLSRSDKTIIENFYVVPAQDEQMEGAEFIKRIHDLIEEIQKRVSNDNEIVCIDAIIHIFRTVENVELLNKRAVFTYIREISGLSAKQLTTTIASLKRHYRELRGSEEFGLY